MIRTLVALATGIAVGAATTYFMIGDRVGDHSSAAAPVADSSREAARVTSGSAEREDGLRRIRAIGTAPLDLAGRADLLRLAASAGPAELESLARETAARPPSASRRFLLAALLARYVEIDASAALAFARELGLEGDALAAAAETSPANAFRQALALTDAAARYAAAPRVARVWASSNPQAALAAASAIEDAWMRQTAQAAVLSVWGEEAPEEVIAHLADGDESARRQLIGAGLLQYAARVDPARLLELAEGLPADVAGLVNEIAIERLAAQDPIAAIEYSKRLSPGGKREQLETAIAQAYGRKDPEAALAWARSLEPPQPLVVNTVLATMASADPSRAFALAAAMEPEAAQRQAMSWIATQVAMQGGDETEAAAAALLALPNGTAKEDALKYILSGWVLSNPRAAVEWTLKHAEDAGPAAVSSVGSRLGEHDPKAAAAYLRQVPREARADWITGIAFGYTRRDPKSALAWVAGLRGDSEYDFAAKTVAVLVAPYDPEQAARLLDTVDKPKSYRSAYTSVVRQWADRDPAASAYWALGIGETTTRSAALSEAAQIWASRDSATARSWAMSLPRAADRDAALTGVMQIAAFSADLDAGLLNGFSTDAARQAAVSEAIFPLAQRDPGAARRLVEDYITDPRLRGHVEQMLECSTD